ncbi:N-acetyltransferase [Butyrivibrio sp. CB08]|uniref:GNAT family N-acetyltransferase n=1 Tax=Butyrivibrio sp. CB08 TaxID=2364879 RepID=UPI000EA9AB58|nr:GNAT family N-acetyltransferase [Butyrivibrio sp. CB08]RKM59965.1 N-acetyltransferase [Butyrivibrio sp. CB08]
MLKALVFLIDKDKYCDEKIKADIDETVRYVRECGYSSELFHSAEEIESSFASEKETTLVATDRGEASEKLLADGYYVVGVLHDDRDVQEFKGAKYVFSEIENVDMDSFVKVFQRYAEEPWEILRTERLLIRETTIEDVDEFYKLYSDPSMTEFIEGLFEDPEDEKRYQRDYIKKVYGLMGFGVWTLVRLSDGAIVGRAGYSVRNGFDEVELGYLIGKDYQRQGYAMEACQAILDYGRDVLQFDKVQTLVKAENEASIAMCEKLGFVKDSEVDVEENIYGNEYKGGGKVDISKATFGKYVRMTRVF